MNPTRGTTTSERWPELTFYLSLSLGYSALEQQQLDPTGPADYKESYYITKDGPQSGNMYPPPSLVPAFRATAERYYDAMVGLTQRVFPLLAECLSLDRKFFDGYTGADGDPSSWLGSALSLVHYPPRPTGLGADRVGCGAHTDFGSREIVVSFW